MASGPGALVASGPGAAVTADAGVGDGMSAVDVGAGAGVVAVLSGVGRGVAVATSASIAGAGTDVAVAGGAVVGGGSSLEQATTTAADAIRRVSAMHRRAAGVQARTRSLIGVLTCRLPRRSLNDAGSV